MGIDIPPCSPDLVSLVVEDSMGALDLARAINCTGGIFEVEWRGYVEFPETIYILNGTVMTISGTEDSIANGGDMHKFLSVDNAFVNISGLQIENCASNDSGGAIFATRSTLIFYNTSFSNNVVNDEYGGALYLSGYDASWKGGTKFIGNYAGGSSYVRNGGALYIKNSNV